MDYLWKGSIVCRFVDGISFSSAIFFSNRMISSWLDTILLIFQYQHTISRHTRKISIHTRRSTNRLIIPLPELLAGACANNNVGVIADIKNRIFFIIILILEFIISCCVQQL